MTTTTIYNSGQYREPRTEDYENYSREIYNIWGPFDIKELQTETIPGGTTDVSYYAMFPDISISNIIISLELQHSIWRGYPLPMGAFVELWNQDNSYTSTGTAEVTLNFNMPCENTIQTVPKEITLHNINICGTLVSNDGIKEWAIGVSARELYKKIDSLLEGYTSLRTTIPSSLDKSDKINDLEYYFDTITDEALESQRISRV